MASSRQRIHLATGNAHKVREFQQLAEVASLDLEFVRPDAMPVVIEDSGTFIGNARKKAVALKSILPPDAWVLADDSGICVDALGGAPGVESAYYAGAQGDSAANLAKLVQVLREVPDGRRGASFHCVLVLLGPSEQEEIFEGRCVGVLLREPAGDAGFGYDPIFIPNGFDRTYSQLSEAAKNKISHRGRAWLILTDWLKTKWKLTERH